jgi:hypothetical protein
MEKVKRTRDKGNFRVYSVTYDANGVDGQETLVSGHYKIDSASKAARLVGLRNVAIIRDRQGSQVALTPETSIQEPSKPIQAPFSDLPTLEATVRESISAQLVAQGVDLSKS